MTQLCDDDHQSSLPDNCTCFSSPKEKQKRTVQPKRERNNFFGRQKTQKMYNACFVCLFCFINNMLWCFTLQTLFSVSWRTRTFFCNFFLLGQNTWLLAKTRSVSVVCVYPFLLFFLIRKNRLLIPYKTHTVHPPLSCCRVCAREQGDALKWPVLLCLVCVCRSKMLAYKSNGP